MRKGSVLSLAFTKLMPPDNILSHTENCLWSEVNVRGGKEMVGGGRKREGNRNVLPWRPIEFCRAHHWLIVSSVIFCGHH